MSMIPILMAEEREKDEVKVMANKVCVIMMTKDRVTGKAKDMEKGKARGMVKVKAEVMARELETEAKL